MATENTGKPRRRIAATDFASAEALLKAAALLIVPDDQTQRQAFERLMPHLYILKNKGCSFPQIANLLAQIGFNLQPSGVRIYYNEILAERMDMCQSRMNEQILLLAEVRKQTKDTDVAAIGSRVAAIMNQQQAQVASKLDAVFGPVPTAVSPPVAVVPVATPAPVPPPVAAPVTPVEVTPRTGNKKTGLRPSPLNASPGVPPVTTKQQEEVTTRINTAALPSVVSTGNWKCSPLPDGLKSLGKRDGVAKDMYLPGNLEHPAIPNVWLTLEQRLSPVALEFINAEDGEIRLETDHEKRFRILWRIPAPLTETRTGGSFTKMDMSLFVDNKQPKST